MSRARLGYDFVAVPRRRHAGWVGLANGCGQFLFAPLFELAEGAPIPIHGADWRVWLCRVWCLAGRARSPVCKALDELAERGVIAAGEGSISVLFRPEDRHNSSTEKHRDDTTRAHSDSETTELEQNTCSHLGLSVENNSTPKTQTDRQKRKTEEREADRAPASDFRRPVGEPPPGFVETFQEPPPELSLEDQILTAWKAAVHTRTLRTPGSTKLATDGAAEVAKWLRENIRDNETPLGAFQVALKLYLAEDKKNLVDNTWPLKWLTERLPGYLAAKQPEKRTVANPTHAIWQAPDYEAENREINARAERNRLAWLAEHPELAEAAAEQDDLIPTPRVVVSIVEAKPPARSYRAKSPEELQARRAQLAEQERLIRSQAASE